MYKQVIVVRKDLNMSRGKMAVQVAHASLESYRNARPNAKKMWLLEGQKKVVLYVEGLEDFYSITSKCEKLGVNYSIIRDAGETELPPGTITCIGIGPEKEEVINKITGNLPLVK